MAQLTTHSFGGLVSGHDFCQYMRVAMAIESSSEVNPHQSSHGVEEWSVQSDEVAAQCVERYGYVADGNHKSTKLGAGFKDCSLCLPLFRWGNDPFWERILKHPVHLGASVFMFSNWVLRQWVAINFYATNLKPRHQDPWKSSWILPTWPQPTGTQ